MIGEKILQKAWEIWLARVRPGPTQIYHERYHWPGWTKILLSTSCSRDGNSNTLEYPVFLTAFLQMLALWRAIKPGRVPHSCSCPKGLQQDLSPKQRPWGWETTAGLPSLPGMLPVIHQPRSVPGVLEWNVVQEESDAETLSLDHSLSLPHNRVFPSLFSLIMFYSFMKKRCACPYQSKEISPCPLLLHQALCWQKNVHLPF